MNSLAQNKFFITPWITPRNGFIYYISIQPQPHNLFKHTNNIIIKKLKQSYNAKLNKVI